MPATGGPASDGGKGTSHRLRARLEMTKFAAVTAVTKSFFERIDLSANCHRSDQCLPVNTPVAVECGCLRMRGRSPIPSPQQGSLYNRVHGKSVRNQTLRIQNPLLLQNDIA